VEEADRVVIGHGLDAIHAEEGRLPAVALDLLGQPLAGWWPSSATCSARAVAFGCDLGALGPTGGTVEQWEDVPAVSDGYGAAPAAIAARLPVAR
jgi:hypothetical protein